MTSVGEPIQKSRRHFGIAKHTGPLSEAQIGRNQDTRFLVRIGKFGMPTRTYDDEISASFKHLKMPATSDEKIRHRKPSSEEQREVRIEMKRLRASHIKAALKRIDAGKSGEFSSSVRYDLIFKGNHYSPKQVIGFALEALTGKSYNPYHFNGGANTSCFRTLESLGFEIQDKTESALAGKQQIDPDNSKRSANTQNAMDLARSLAEKAGAFDLSLTEDARKKAYAFIVRRQGQGAFRESLMRAYDHKCAITGCSVEAVLEAAHITPYLGPQTNVVTNGLLLRSDIHVLFDLGLLWIDWKSLRVGLSKDLCTGPYAELYRRKIQLPLHMQDWPSAYALSLHSKFKP